jgi:Cd2+/Zn2+-exporting ATPase
LGLFAFLFAADRMFGLASLWGGACGWVLPFGLYLGVYLLIGYDVLWRALRNLCHGQALDENFLMCIATVGAFGLAIWRGARGEPTEGFDEACAVLLFYQVGEFFQRYATGKSRRSISELMSIRPDSANVLREGGMEAVFPEEVEVGERILVLPGEKIPLDGVILRGASSVDCRALTGESVPCDVEEGDAVLSGCVNLTTELEILVTKAFYDSTVSKILDLVENASDKKSKAESFITKFARYYTPAVVGLAAGVAVIPGWITGAWSVWLYRALSFLVVSCPCALVISVPMSFFAGIGAASRERVLIKGSNYLEQLERANVFVFDKTGTLTRGSFAVTAVYPENKREEILHLAATAEAKSSHPIAASILAAAKGCEEEGWILTNHAGFGVVATKGEESILCGNEKLMQTHGVEITPADEVGTAVYVAQNGSLKGIILINDEVKEEAREVLGALHRMGARTVMLTGDRQDVAERVARDVGVDDFHASLLPQDKVIEVEALIAEKKKSEVLCFVGDGINDAPVLMRSDIGIAMGALGSDAAIEAADVVLMRDDLRGILTAKRTARKTMRIVRQNIAFSLAVKGAILLLSAFGITNMWIAIFGDVGVAVIAILNAMRVGKNGKTAC